jgi:hypothetical protein
MPWSQWQASCGMRSFDFARLYTGIPLTDLSNKLELFLRAVLSAQPRQNYSEVSMDPSFKSMWHDQSSLLHGHGTSWRSADSCLCTHRLARTSMSTPPSTHSSTWQTLQPALPRSCGRRCISCAPATSTPGTLTTWSPLSPNPNMESLAYTNRNWQGFIGIYLPQLRLEPARNGVESCSFLDLLIQAGVVTWATARFQAVPGQVMVELGTKGYRWGGLPPLFCLPRCHPG